MTRRGRFGRDARLARTRDFEQVIRRGRKLVGPDLLLWCLRRREAPGGSARLGTSVSRKVGGAVRRNRVKRLMREAFRLNRHRLRPGYDLVAYPRPGCGWRGLDEARESLLGLCRKAGLLQDEP